MRAVFRETNVTMQLLLFSRIHSNLEKTFADAYIMFLSFTYLNKIIILYFCCRTNIR